MITIDEYEVNPTLSEPIQEGKKCRHRPEYTQGTNDCLNCRYNHIIDIQKLTKGLERVKGKQYTSGTVCIFERLTGIR